MMCDSAESKIATRGLASPRKDAGRGPGYPPAEGPVPAPPCHAGQQVAGRPTPPQCGVQRKRVPEYSQTSQANSRGAGAAGNCRDQPGGGSFYDGVPWTLSHGYSVGRGCLNTKALHDQIGVERGNVIISNTEEVFQSESRSQYKSDSGPAKGKAYEHSMKEFGQVPSGGFLKFNDVEIRPIPSRSPEAERANTRDGAAKYQSFFEKKDTINMSAVEQRERRRRTARSAAAAPHASRSTSRSTSSSRPACSGGT